VVNGRYSRIASQTEREPIKERGERMGFNGTLRISIRERDIATITGCLKLQAGWPHRAAALSTAFRRLTNTASFSLLPQPLS